MFSLAVFFASLVSLGSCGQCEEEHAEYVRCLGGRVEENFQELEEEYTAMSTAKTDSCFSRRKGGRMCPMSEESKTKGPFDYGYFGSCSICTFPQATLNYDLVQTSAEPYGRFVKLMSDGVKSEIKACLRVKDKETDFDSVVDPIPVHGMDFRTDELPISHYVASYNAVVRNQVAAMQCCGKRTKRCKRTTKCLRFSQGNENAEVHCKHQQDCFASVSEECQEFVEKRNKEMCKCVQRQRELLSRKVQRIPKESVALLSDGKSVEACRRNIISLLTTRGGSWGEIVTEAFMASMGGSAFINLKRPMRPLCRILREAGKTGDPVRIRTAPYEIRNLTQFAFGFIDASIERYHRFFCLSCGNK